MNPLFTVLLPVNRAPDLLQFAIESERAQYESSFELVVILRWCAEGDD
jgi:hypothetical protein